jgi:hypothetical protein
MIASGEIGFKLANRIQSKEIKGSYYKNKKQQATFAYCLLSTKV